MRDTARGAGGRGGDLTVVIPAYNEVNGIGGTLEQLRRGFPDVEIIVVDDGSTDGTAEAAAAFDDVILVRHAFNRGYGASLKSGMRLASRSLIAWFDADNEHRASDLDAMVTALTERRLAAVLGERINPGSSPIRTMGKWAIRMVARSLRFKPGKDLNCGLRVFRREVILPYLSVLPNGFSASLTSTMVMVERGYPMAFHPVESPPRIGESKVRLADGLSALGMVVNMIMLFAPLRIFAGLGLALLVVGGMYGLYVALSVGLGVPTAALFMMLSGVILCVLGLIANQVSQLRLSLIPPGVLPDADTTIRPTATSGRKRKPTGRAKASKDTT